MVAGVEMVADVETVADVEVPTVSSPRLEAGPECVTAIGPSRLSTMASDVTTPTQAHRSRCPGERGTAVPRAPAGSPSRGKRNRQSGHLITGGG
jgi:hypothetical protein